MSELNNLSAPIEESPEEISRRHSKVEEKKQLVQKEKIREEFKVLTRNFKQKYLKKLLISLGIAVTVCVALLWLISSLLAPDSATAPETVPEETIQETPINQGETVKYRKFDGHQYSFYVPESYSFLNRTRNDDLNEIVFSYDVGETAFILQEFEADNDNEETLDSIYSYIITTLPPDENTEIKIGDNTLKRRIYKECIDPLSDTGETIPDSEPYCGGGNVYYSIYINGLIVIFHTANTPENDIETTILPTLTKNVIDAQALTEEYLYDKLPSITNKLQAQFAFGVPIAYVVNGNSTEITWKTTGDLEFVLGFDSNKMLVSKKGIYKDNFNFDLESGPPLSTIKVGYDNLMANRKVQSQILVSNPEVVIFIDDHVSGNDFWEITIKSSPETGNVLLGEYTQNKTTNIVREKTLD